MPSRYYTPVKVWCRYTHPAQERWEHFSDLQMAYLFVKSVMGDHPSEEWDPLPGFVAFANMLDDSSCADEHGIYINLSCHDAQLDVYYDI